MKKILTIIGGIVVGLIVLGILLFVIISITSKKLVCKSSEGNITIMYDNKTITGYTAVGLSYDMNSQREIAEEVGIKEYIEDFIEFFNENTTGSCKK